MEEKLQCEDIIVVNFSIHFIHASLKIRMEFREKRQKEKREKIRDLIDDMIEKEVRN